MKYYLGVDAGGTHTRFVMFDESGNQIDRIDRESIHYARVGFEGIQTILQEVKDAYEIKNYNFKDVGVAFGMAGYGEDIKIRTGIEDAVWSVFPNAFITNDAKFAMMSVLGNEDGVYIISGTGSIALRKVGCTYDRRGGFGYLIGDEGSAFWIGKKVLEAFTKEADGRLPRTTLYDEVLKHYQLETAYDLVALSRKHEDDYRTWIAEFSYVASKTDSVHVDEIFKNAGKELALLANSFELNGKTSIALGGSVLIKNEIVKKALLNNLSSSYKYIESNRTVEYAAYLLLRNN